MNEKKIKRVSFVLNGMTYLNINDEKYYVYYLSYDLIRRKQEITKEIFIKAEAVYKNKTFIK